MLPTKSDEILLVISLLPMIINLFGSKKLKLPFVNENIKTVARAYIILIRQ
jgi:hypothetical protein